MSVVKKSITYTEQQDLWVKQPYFDKANQTLE